MLLKVAGVVRQIENFIWKLNINKQAKKLWSKLEIHSRYIMRQLGCWICSILVIISVGRTYQVSLKETKNFFLFLMPPRVKNHQSIIKKNEISPLNTTSNIMLMSNALFFFRTFAASSRQEWMKDNMCGHLKSEKNHRTTFYTTSCSFN